MDENRTIDQDRIMKINIEEEMKSAYIDYSMSVIVARALPDVRDGFKPVHRRILYGMLGLGNTSDKPYKKCARVVGACCRHHDCQHAKQNGYESTAFFCFHHILITDTLLYYCSICSKNQYYRTKESLNRGKTYILRKTCFIFVLNVLLYEKKLVTLHLEKSSKRLRTQIKAVKRNLNNKKITWTRIGQLTRTAS